MGMIISDTQGNSKIEFCNKNYILIKKVLIILNKTIYKIILCLRILTILFLSACHYTGRWEEELVLIQIQDRNGISETISAEERLVNYSTINFLAAQPYKKILRTYRSEGKNRSVITTYHPNGMLYQMLEVKEMRAFGLFQEWFANGTKKIEATVVGGSADLTTQAQETRIFDGLMEVWNETAQLVAQIQYEKGILFGISIAYYPSGLEQQKIPYFQDQIHGTVQSFWDNGNLREEAPYHFGVREGITLGFWPNGEHASEEEHKEGLLCRAAYWNLKGERIAAVTEANGFRGVFNRENLSELQEIREGLIEGNIREFNAQGTLLRSYNLKNDKKQGEEITYFIPDKSATAGSCHPKLSIQWDLDTVHGIIKSWYRSGQMQSQREFCRNKRCGIACAWYLGGSLMLLEEYENDQLIKGQYYKKNLPEPISSIVGGNGTAFLYDEEGLFLQKIPYAKGQPIEQ